MKKQIEYLTDAELECLISEIELQEMIVAPPDLQEHILEIVESKKTAVRTGKEQNLNDKLVEYKRFRFRVLTTVAAAVLMVFLLPRIESLQQPEAQFQNAFFDQKSVVEKRYATREEALNNSGVMESLLGGVNIFAGNNNWNLFKE